MIVLNLNQKNYCIHHKDDNKYIFWEIQTFLKQILLDYFSNQINHVKTYFLIPFKFRQCNTKIKMQIQLCYIISTPETLSKNQLAFENSLNSLSPTIHYSPFKFISKWALLKRLAKVDASFVLFKQYLTYFISFQLGLTSMKFKRKNCIPNKIINLFAIPTNSSLSHSTQLYFPTNLFPASSLRLNPTNRSPQFIIEITQPKMDINEYSYFPDLLLSEYLPLNQLGVISDSPPLLDFPAQSEQSHRQSMFDTKELPPMLEEEVVCVNLQLMEQTITVMDAVDEAEVKIEDEQAERERDQLGGRGEREQMAVEDEPENSTKQKSRVDDSKNLLINIGTQLKNYMERVCSEQELVLFYQIFGKRKTYKGLDKFTRLFSSPLKNHCVEFFDSQVLRMLITSKTSRKAGMIKYLGVLRQGAIRGEISNLTIRPESQL